MIPWVVAAADAIAAEAVPSEEIVVVAERRIDAAEQDMIRSLRSSGYLRVLSLGDRTWFVNRKVWKPWLMVHDEGFARIRTIPALPIGPTRMVEAGMLPDPAFPGMQSGSGDKVPEYGVAFLTTSPRARKAHRARVAGQLEPYLREMRDARWEHAKAERAIALWDELATIWIDGLDPEGARLRTPAERRAAIVERWLATAPGEAGDWARALIETWIDDEVQAQHPYTPEEIAQVNARRSFERPFAPLER